MHEIPRAEAAKLVLAFASRVAFYFHASESDCGGRGDDSRCRGDSHGMTHLRGLLWRPSDDVSVIARQRRPFGRHDVEILRARIACQKIATAQKRELPSGKVGSLALRRNFPSNCPQFGFHYFTVPNHRKLNATMGQKRIWLRRDLSGERIPPQMLPD